MARSKRAKRTTTAPNSDMPVKAETPMPTTKPDDRAHVSPEHTAGTGHIPGNKPAK